MDDLFICIILSMSYCRIYLLVNLRNETILNRKKSLKNQTSSITQVDLKIKKKPS
jgi:hypothetical protein